MRQISGTKSSTKSGYFLRMSFSTVMVSVVTYAICRPRKFFNWELTIWLRCGRRITIVPKQEMERFAISALTSVTYSLNSFTIS